MWNLKSALFGRSKQESSAAAEDQAPAVLEQKSAATTTSASASMTRHFLAPSDLEVTDVGPKSALLIGACFLFEWGDALHRLGYSDLTIDRLLFYNLVRLPASPPKPVESYDVQLVQIPLPSLMPEQEYFRLPADDLQSYE